MGKWLAIQQLFPYKSSCHFWYFKLLPNFIFQCYRPQTWQFYLFLPALSVSGIHEVLGIKLRVGRSPDPQLQKANLFYLSIPFNHNCVLSYAAAGKQVQCMWTNWNFQIQIQRATLKSWGFVRGKKGIWLKFVLVSLSIASRVSIECLGAPDWITIRGFSGPTHSFYLRYFSLNVYMIKIIWVHCR